ncbi:nucleoid-associated protein [bacterium]|nr:nucleoid-associated protein [bacterium]
MIIDLRALKMKKLIIHEVPRQLRVSPGTLAPVFSDVESLLDLELKEFFATKIMSSISSSSAFAVEFNSTIASPVPGLIKGYLTGRPDFVFTSKTITQHLFSCQTAVNSGGLLTFIDCSFNSVRSLAILKVEKEDGVKAERSKVKGKSTFSMEYIKDLLLTQKTKLYKIGLFSSLPKNKYEIYVCDNQRLFSSSSGEIANFFLQKFLGCKLKDEPEVITKHFFLLTEEFINNNFIKAEERAEIHTHLISELLNNNNSINPHLFAQSYLPTPLRNPYIEELTVANIGRNAFSKDIRLIAKRVKSISLAFKSGIAITGKQDIVQDKVKMTTENNGETLVEFRDEFEGIQGK